MPIMSGLCLALEKDRPKMFRYLYDRVGNTTEVFVKSLPKEGEQLHNVKQSIETIKILDNIFRQQLFIKDTYTTTSYRNSFKDSIIFGKEQVDLPFVKYLYEDPYSSLDFEEYDSVDFAPKVEEYIRNN